MPAIWLAVSLLAFALSKRASSTSSLDRSGTFMSWHLLNSVGKICSSLSATKINKVFSSYTLSSLDERDSIIEMNLKTAGTLTIPADTPNLTFPIGTTIDVIQTNSGQITIGSAFGVNLNATPGLKIRSQWSIATLLKRDANTWLVFGDLTA